MRSHSRLRAGLAVAGTAFVALAVAACGDDNKDKSGASKLQHLEVTLGADGKLSGFQPVKSGLTQIGFANQTKKKYDLQLVRVVGNHTLAEVLKVTTADGPVPIPTFMQGGGGVGTTDAGKSATITQVLDGGRYFVLAEPDQGGKPVTAEMNVSGGKGTGTLPPADAKVTATEYKFQTTGLKSGTQKIEFDNDGAQLHHAIFFPLKAGVTLAQAKKFITTRNPTGPPPFDQKRNGPSTTVIDSGVKQVFDAKLDPGKYALVCFLSDRKGGPPHVVKGMIAEVDVT
jgi:hypothetical protein